MFAQKCAVFVLTGLHRISGRGLTKNTVFSKELVDCAVMPQRVPRSFGGRCRNGMFKYGAKTTVTSTLILVVR